MPCGGCSTLYGVNPYYRSSRPDVFCIKGVLENFAKFAGKHLWILQNFPEHLCQRPFFNYLKKLYLKRVSGKGTFL